jgi:hypothetical protein
MSGPFIAITSGRIRAGKLAEYRELNAAITARIEKQEPRLIAFHVMLSGDGERFTSMQLHPDVQSMEFHIKVVSDLIKDAGEVIEVEMFTVLGASNESFDDYMKAMADSGIVIHHLPEHVRGFTRSSAAD